MTQHETTRHDRTLLAVVAQYQSLAMMALGKMQNPATGEVERDLTQARAFIDILEMLKVKCRTGTPDEILRMLDGAVMDLQLNFLEEQKKDAADGAEAGTGSDEDASSAESDAETDEKESTS